MLILTRRTGQSFQIGEDIRITITEISGDKVRIGIEAPQDMRVLREELCRTMESNRQAVSGVSGDALRALAANLAKSTGPSKPGTSPKDEAPKKTQKKPPSKP